MQQVSDLAGGQHIIASQASPNGGRSVDVLTIGNRDGHGRKDQQHPADISRASTDTFKDVLTTAADICGHLHSIPQQTRLPRTRARLREMAKPGNDNLRQALASAGITGEELAELIKVDTRTVRRWLTGQPPTPATASRSSAPFNSQNTTSGQKSPHPTLPPASRLRPARRSPPTRTPTTPARRARLP